MPQAIRVSDFRTQIYFPKHLYYRAKQYATSRNVSLAAVVREAMVEKFGLSKEKTPPNDLLKYAGTLKGGPKDLSQNTPKYLKQMYRQKFP